jgi:hypothetical protein
MQRLLPALALLLAFSGLAQKHLEMDYGSVISATISAPFPDDNVAVKGIAFKLPSQVLPAAGTPVGKGRFLRGRKEIAGSELQEVYKYQRERSNGYLIATPPGSYTITLQFAELKRDEPGERVFDIFIQDQRVRTDFDIFVEAGENKAIDLSFADIAVPADGLLRLRWGQKSTRSTPSIAGIIIANAAHTHKINCGGDATGDYVADWDKYTYLDDPFSCGMLFDATHLRWAAVWEYGFLDLRGVVYDGSHGDYPEIIGRQLAGTDPAPAWNQPGRFLSRDIHKQAIRYAIGDAIIGDQVSLQASGDIQRFCRHLTLSKNPGNLRERLLKIDGEFKVHPGAVVITKDEEATVLKVDGAELLMLEGHAVAAYRYATKATITLWRGPADKAPAVLALPVPGMLRREPPTTAPILTTTTTPPSLIPDPQTPLGDVPVDPSTQLKVIPIPLPVDNPHRSWMRTSGFDISPDGQLALATWSGDIWIARDLETRDGEIKWHRYASGLFQPLGIRIIGDDIWATCMDQLARLRDHDKDGLADTIDAFATSIQTTPNFHEFTFDLQTDADGNFYFMKGAPVKTGGKGFDPIGPHHGTLLRVSSDGQKVDVIASGFRVCNGIWMDNPKRFYMTDNEGDWVPSTPINLVEPGGFYGVQPTAQGEVPAKRGQLVTWVPHEVDNSGGCIVRVPKDQWGYLGGELIHCSYGQAKLFHILTETIDGVTQGGVVHLPTDGEFTSSLMRARWSPNGDLFVGGLQGWQTRGVDDGGLFRVRFTGGNPTRVKGLRIAQNGIEISFSTPVAAESATDAGNYSSERWCYRVANQYGSAHYRLPDHDWDFATAWDPLPLAEIAKAKAIEDPEEREQTIAAALKQREGHDRVAIRSISIADDRRSVFLEIPDMRPAMQYQLGLNLPELATSVYHTVHRIGDWQGKAGKAITTRRLERPAAGLLQAFTHLGQKTTDTRVSRLAALHVDVGESVTTFLDSGPFSCRIEGYIKVDANTEVHVTADASGEHRISINGAVLDRPTVALKKGLNRLLIDYTSPAQGAAFFRLYWQGPDFPREPIPATAFTHESRPDERRRGHAIADRLACFHCHQGGDFAPRALPILGNQAYKHPFSVTGELPTAESLPAGNAESGKALFTHFGCAACHDRESLEAAKANYVTIDLTAHRPDFRLSPAESADLASYLGMTPGKQAELPENCASCHGTANPSASTIIGKPFDPAAHSPTYSIPVPALEALRSFLAGPAPRPCVAEFAERVVQRENCAACHERDGASSNWPSTDHLQRPPLLSHIGEKLRTSHLEGILSGEAESVRPWHKGRMPSFPHAKDLAVGLAKQHGYGADAPKTETLENPDAIHAPDLIGDKGFNCFICHPLGARPALAPFGAPGPDLAKSANRLRDGYYHRWMLNPQRVDSKVPMTRFSADLETTHLPALDSDARRQFQAMLDYLRK